MTPDTQLIVKPSPLPPRRMRDRVKQLLSDWFLIGMVSAVVLALFLPDLGRSAGLLRLEKVADVGIFLVFLLHGMGIGTEQLRSGASRWRLHLLVQVATYVFFPLLGVGLNALVGRWVPPALALGFLYLCALPSTISSSVAMTAAAKGNVPGAIFNATLSSLLGIVLTPLLLNLVASTTGQGLPLGPAVLKLSTLLLLPFCLGQVLRRFVGPWFARYKPYTTKVDRGVILLLVLNSFSDSVHSGLLTSYGPSILLITLAGAAVLLACALVSTTLLARRLHFERGDEIAAVFCGSKKTLASGMPMAKLLFGAHPGLGLIVLPIMLYHQLQLFVCSILADRYAAGAALAEQAQAQAEQQSA
jgi:sodium/bile acid cotransporter 7